MIKATTNHGTYYLIDMEKYRAKRVRGKGRNEMSSDENWFVFASIAAFPNNGIEPEPIEVGRSIHFNVVNDPIYDWRLSTRVTSIEEYNE